MYRIYTDGACAVHTNKCGGCAALIFNPDGSELMYRFHECKTTSQRMELTGAIVGLNAVPVGAAVELKTDSMYLVQGILGEWKLNKNLDLWEILRSLDKARKVTWTWIPRNSEKDHARVDGAANTKSKECGLDKPKQT